MSFDAVSIIVFLLAVSLLGLSKGGLSGFGFLSMPLMILVMPPAAAAGLILPILMIQDAYGVWLYRGRWSVPNLKLLLPAAVVGIGLGFALFAVLPVRAMLGVLGVISLAFALRGLYTGFFGSVLAQPPKPALGVVLGIVSGLTSTVLHQGGPPFQIYLIPQRLPREVFAGTTIVFFAIVNFIKLPGFIALGQLTREGLIVAAVSAPFALAMTFIGARIVRFIDADRFYIIIHLLLAGVGVKLIADAVL